VRASPAAVQPKIANLFRFYTAEDRRRMAGQGDLRRSTSADLPSLRDDAREEEGRKAVLRLFDRKEGEAGSPQLLLVKCAVVGGLGEHVLLDFKCRSRKRYVEERALAVAQVREGALLPCLVRRKSKLGLAHQLLKPAFDQ